MAKLKKNIKPAFLLILAGMVAVIWYAVFYFESHQQLMVTVFDVGQGDSIFIELPNGNQALIDGGPDDRVLSRLGRRMPFWDRFIDLVILTHPHADHVSGLIEILKRYDVGMVLESGQEYSTAEYREWRELIARKEVPVTIALSRQVVQLGEGAKLKVLSPFEDSGGVSLKNPHDATVSTKLIYGDTSLLFMGDAEKEIEYRLVAEEGMGLQSDILKVGHHGSKTSSAEVFLRAVWPEIAVISVGRKNRYGHPHQEVLDRLSAMGIQVLRTDVEGDLKFVSDGTISEVEPH